MTKQTYTVGIETDVEGGPWITIPDDLFDRLLRALDAETEIFAAVLSFGGIAGGPGVQLSIQAPAAAEAAERAIAAWSRALATAGLEAPRIGRVDVMTEDFQHRWLSEPATEYVGVGEIAELLGVSKQRVFQLRARKDVPRPIAELAAGPVWTRASLNHFIAGWDRRPGARPKELTDGEREALEYVFRGGTVEGAAKMLGLPPLETKRAMERLRRARNTKAHKRSDVVQKAAKSVRK